MGVAGVTGDTVEPTGITAIEIPDATREPDAYVQALVDTLGDREPVGVYGATAGEVDRLCAELSPAEWNVPLADGEWTAAQIIGHLVDVDIVYGFRLRLVLTETDPAYPGYDEKLWSQLPKPAPASLLVAFAGIRAYNTALLRQTTPEQWQRTGRHGEQGGEPLSLMVAKLAGHDLAHLNQLERTVAVATQQKGSQG